MKKTFDEKLLQSALVDVTAKFANAKTVDELNAIKREYVGETSVITLASKAIGTLDAADKAQAGKVLGEVRAEFGRVFSSVEAGLKEAEELAELKANRVDVSVVTAKNSDGARHPLQVMMEDVANFFVSIGWRVAEGPQIETQWFNFDALNFGVDHPARGMQDTFYAKQENLVLRTHTSPVQVHSMIEQGAPVYIACPGRVFRTDELDATHTPVFHQCEGLAVDKGLSMANLKGTLDAFAKAMFGPEAHTRLRPSYFPFTEPSAEMDVWFEGKKGGPGWIEWGGCGMVNPNVLLSAGLDPEEYSGFAFGMGIERTLMLRHNIADMHDIVEGDVRFSRQFGQRS